MTCRVKGTESMLAEKVKGNHYARYHNHSYHKYRETHLSILLHVKFWQSQWSVTCRSRVPGQGACFLSKSRTITMQGFIILATISTEKHTLVFYSSSRRKIWQSQRSVKCRSRCVLVEHVKDNYYARFHNPCYHRYWEINCDRSWQTDRNLNSYITPCYKQVR